MPDDLVAAACLLRRQSPTITCEEASKLLVAQFGPERGAISATSLKRIWKEAGLAQPRGGHRGGAPRQDVDPLSGGGGLALIAAAAVETGIIEELGAAAVAQVELAVARQPEVQSDANDSLRDELGRFTPDYNRAVRGDGPRDPRWDPDSAKQARGLDPGLGQSVENQHGIEVRIAPEARAPIRRGEGGALAHAGGGILPPPTKRIDCRFGRMAETRVEAGRAGLWIRSRWRSADRRRSETSCSPSVCLRC